MTTVAFTLNGRPITADVQPRTHLADFLRDSRRLSGTHLGCEHGVCGACTVLLNGVPARSCITLAVACDGLEVTTIEGLDDDAVMGDLREAFTREHGLQCGFCTPGMLIAARDIVLRLPGANERKIREELSGNLCRCTGYVGIVNAVASVVDKHGQKTSVRPVAAMPMQPEQTPVMATFVPASQPAAALTGGVPAPAENAGQPATQAGKAAQGWTRFEESFVIAQPRAHVWELFGDIPRVAGCLPGAQVLSHDGRTVKGRMVTKLGPISASFAGSAVIERDPESWSGTIVGAGSDGGSGSRTKGEIVYRLESIDQDAATRVSVTVLYSLQGALAQFSRSGLAQEFARHLVSQFASNIRSQFGDSEQASVSQASSLVVSKVLWSMAKEWVRRIFVRSS